MTINEELLEKMLVSYGDSVNKLVAMQTAQQKSIDDLIQNGNAHGQSFRFKHTLDGATGQDVPAWLHEDSFFQDCALDSTLLNYLLVPTESYFSTVPSRASMFTDHKIGMLTGMETTITGTRPVNNCDDPQCVDHSFDWCKMNFPWDRLMLCSSTLEVDTLLRKACANQYEDFFFIGDIRGVSQPPNRRLEPLNDRNLITQSAVLRALAAMARVFQFWRAEKFWTGNPINNTANGGYAEPVGLEHFFTDSFATDPVFANLLESSSGDLADCSAMNADIKDFGGLCVNDPAADPNIWTLMQELVDTLMRRARALSYSNVTWHIVMNSILFYELARVLPCQISTDGCITLNTSLEAPKQGQIDMAQMQRDRENLMDRRAIRILGKDFPVYFDDFIPATVGQAPDDTEITSDIWFVPRIVDGMETLYHEFINYEQWDRVMSPIPGSITDAFGWSDGGKYLSTLKQKLFCFNINTKTEGRLIFRFSPLAGKIENVKACTIQKKPSHFFIENPQTLP